MRQLAALAAIAVSVAALAGLAGCTRSTTTATPAAADPPAVEEAERAVAAAPKDPEARDVLGETLLLLGSLERAERAFGEALEVAPGFATAHHGVAVVRFHRGDAAGGVAALRSGVALTPAVDPTYARTRLLEGLAWAHALEGREREARDVIEESVAAQGLPAEVAPRVAHVGCARLLLHAGRWADALAEAAAARAPGAPPFAARAAAVVEVLAHAGAGDAAAAVAALAPLAADPEAAEHPGVAEAKLAVALARGELDAAAALVPTLEALDPYAAEQATFALARALLRAGRAADAKAKLAALAARYLRSVPSAYTRRAAQNELERLAAAAR